MWCCFPSKTYQPFPTENKLIGNSLDKDILVYHIIPFFEQRYFIKFASVCKLWRQACFLAETKLFSTENFYDVEELNDRIKPLTTPLGDIPLFFSDFDMSLVVTKSQLKSILQSPKAKYLRTRTFYISALKGNYQSNIQNLSIGANNLSSRDIQLIMKHLGKLKTLRMYGVKIGFIDLDWFQTLETLIVHFYQETVNNQNFKNIFKPIHVSNLRKLSINNLLNPIPLHLPFDATLFPNLTSLSFTKVLLDEWTLNNILNSNISFRKFKYSGYKGEYPLQSKDFSKQLLIENLSINSLQDTFKYLDGKKLKKIEILNHPHPPSIINIPLLENLSSCVFREMCQIGMDLSHFQHFCSSIPNITSLVVTFNIKGVMEPLETLQNLKIFKYYSEISPNDFEFISKIRSLEVLEIPSNKLINTAAIKHLCNGQLVRLKRLCLNFMQLDIENLRIFELGNLKKLRELDVKLSHDVLEYIPDSSFIKQLVYFGALTLDISFEFNTLIHWISSPGCSPNIVVTAKPMKKDERRRLSQLCKLKGIRLRCIFSDRH